MLASANLLTLPNILIFLVIVVLLLIIFGRR
jgi:hypothetical protein